MEWLKDLIKGDVAEDRLEAIVESFKKEFPKHAVPKSEFNKINGELEAANNSIQEMTNQVEQIKGNADNSEELKNQLNDITAELEKVKSESSKRETNYVKLEKVKAGLSKKFNADAVDLLAKEFNLDELMLNEAKEIVDFESKITKLAEARPSLTIKTNVVSDIPGDKNTDKPDVDYSKMTDEEYYAAKAAEGSK